MAAQQKRMLTAHISKLGKADLTRMLRSEDSWAHLSKETRERLYTLLPAPAEGQPLHDPDVHPLKTSYKSWIMEEIRIWQEDLTSGREGKKWRAEAMQASKDRVDGKYDEWIEKSREEYWGKREENEEDEDELQHDGDGLMKDEAMGEASEQGQGDGKGVGEGA